jgi:hypothetical protein
MLKPLVDGALRRRFGLPFDIPTILKEKTTMDTKCTKKQIGLRVLRELRG